MSQVPDGVALAPVGWVRASLAPGQLVVHLPQWSGVPSVHASFVPASDEPSGGGVEVDASSASPTWSEEAASPVAQLVRTRRNISHEARLIPAAYRNRNV